MPSKRLGGILARVTDAHVSGSPTRGAPIATAPSGARRWSALAAELFAERGYRATTVREIADAAGVLSGSLYHHFDSKESIIDELLSSYLDELLAQYRAIVSEGGSSIEVLSRLVQAAFGSFDRHRAAITVFQNERQYLLQLPALRLPGQDRAGGQPDLDEGHP